MACKQKEPNFWHLFFLRFWRMGLNCNELQWTHSQKQIKENNQNPTTIKKISITPPNHVHQQPEPAASNQGAIKHPQNKVMAKHDLFFKSRMIPGHKDEPKEKLCLYCSRMNVEFNNR